MLLEPASFTVLVTLVEHREVVPVCYNDVLIAHEEPRVELEVVGELSVLHTLPLVVTVDFNPLSLVECDLTAPHVVHFSIFKFMRALHANDTAGVLRVFITDPDKLEEEKVRVLLNINAQKLLRDHVEFKREHEVIIYLDAAILSQDQTDQEGLLLAVTITLA